MIDHSVIQALLSKARGEYVFSGAQLCHHSPDFSGLLVEGRTSHWPDGESVDAFTRFDIGSITKVICTTSLLARAVDRGTLDLDSSLSHFDSGLGRGPMGLITVRDLLSHCSGATWWVPFYQQANGAEVLEYLFANQSSLFPEPPRKRVCYSDVGFWALGFVLRQLGVTDLRREFASEISGPLAMAETFFSPIPNSSGKIACTEYRSEKRAALCGEAFDENAVAMGGVATHAGLFSTASDLGKFAAAWVSAWHGESAWLSAQVAKEFTQRRSMGLAGDTWAMGWDTRSATGSSSGSHFSAKSFGILGFPGCSLWVDPEARGYVVFLSNRVHPSRWDERIRALRPVLHDAIASQWRQTKRAVE